jgi:hypothetical protein
MNCEECKKPIEEIKDSIVEWISCEDWALSMYVRLVHPGCCYYEKRREILEEMDANDHWLPLADIETLLDIAWEMPWDDKILAESAFIRYIRQRNHNGGTNHEDNKP